MTLKEWLAKANIMASSPTTEVGAVSFIAQNALEIWPDLHKLEDYRVGSIISAGPDAGLVWLVPKPTNRELCLALLDAYGACTRIKRTFETYNNKKPLTGEEEMMLKYFDGILLWLDNATTQFSKSAHK